MLRCCNADDAVDGQGNGKTITLAAEASDTTDNVKHDAGCMSSDYRTKKKSTLTKADGRVRHMSL